MPETYTLWYKTITKGTTRYVKYKEPDSGFVYNDIDKCLRRAKILLTSFIQIQIIKNSKGDEK